MAVPACRIQSCNDAPVRSEGNYVLYWMVANRRLSWNFSLDRALEWSGQLGRPLVALEPLRCDYPWASVRLHRFVIQGMVDNANDSIGKPVTYYPYVEPELGAGRGLLAACAERACVVVTDDFPCFFLPRMIAAAAAKLPVRLEKVDSNGLWPMRATDKVFGRAVDFRRFLQRDLPARLAELPQADPWSKAIAPPRADLPQNVSQRWPRAAVQTILQSPSTLSFLPIDQRVGPALRQGGLLAGRAQLQSFLDRGLPRYHEDRNNLENEAASGLSPYLHFGHISAHEIWSRLVTRECWTADRMAPRPTASREGWWGMSPAAESFVDEFVTWRELGYNRCALSQDYDQFDSLPAWARQTLEKHAADPRPRLYSREQLESADTHDPLWNAAQNQLVREGRMHNYLRMLWGKKILEWSPTPQDAWETLIELNNRYAVDGRNPNSYSGIGWVLGRYDRPWGPERPIFGSIRYMSSDNTARKLRVQGYLQKYAPHAAQRTLFDV